MASYSGSSFVSESSRARSPPVAVRKYKVILLGEVGSGKRSLVRRLQGGGFLEFSSSEDSRGKEQVIFTIRIDEHEVQLAISDPAGMDRLGSLTRNYYLYSKGIVMVYDTTDVTSLNQISKWQSESMMYLSDAVTMLLGNKFDNMTETNAEHAEIQEKAESMVQNHNFVSHKLVSCKTGAGIQEAFEEFARILYQCDAGNVNNPFKDDSAVKRSIINVKQPSLDQEESSDGNSKNRCSCQ